jgi:hypothetical protein
MELKYYKLEPDNGLSNEEMGFSNQYINFEHGMWTL